MKLKHIEKNTYVDIDTGEQVSGDPRDLNIHVAYFMDTIMHFGKYKGVKISEIWEKDPGYIKWMKKEGFSIYVEFEPHNITRVDPNHSINVYKPVMLTEKGLENGADVMARDIKNNLDSKMFDKYPEIFDDEEDVPWDD